MTRFLELAGSERSPLPGSRPAGPVDHKEEVAICLRVASRGDLAALERAALDLAQSPPGERAYLTLDSLERDYGAKPEDLDRIEFYANRHNLAVIQRSAVERTIVLSGKLGDFLAAFRATLRNYHHDQGSYRARTGPILIPDDLHGIITGVFGFDTRPKHRSRFRTLSAAMSGPDSESGLVATDFAIHYDYPLRFDGSGQTIALIELGGGYRSSDLQVFFQEHKAPLPNVTWIPVAHGSNAPTGDPNSADGEVMLDIEVAGAVAPKATIAVYFGPNTDRGFQQVLSKAVHDREHAPSVLSISWGEPEDFLTDQSRKAYHEIFVAAASLGVTVCAASGDHGSADMDGASWDHKLHVNHPASDPFVLGCGGTQIEQGVDVVWNDGTPFSAEVPGGGGWASGGGFSTTFALPDYQTGLVAPPAGGGRGVPDIALSATNYITRVDGSEGVSGGTSAATPLMAALVAAMNQSLGARAGLLQPFLYAKVGAGIVKPVTSGTNLVSGSGIPGYPAKAGEAWNGSTGLGTPIGSAMLEALTQWKPALARPVPH